MTDERYSTIRYYLDLIQEPLERLYPIMNIGDSLYITADDQTIARVTVVFTSGDKFDAFRVAIINKAHGVIDTCNIGGTTEEADADFFIDDYIRLFSRSK